MTNSLGTFATQLLCLRCGQGAVIIPFLFALTKRDTFSCQNCQTEHYLEVRQSESRILITYDRYTLKYPLDDYGPNEIPIVAKLHSSFPYKEKEDGESFSGPWVIYPRKKSYTKNEVEQIWIKSSCKCHLCGKSWKLEERSQAGWHIDHIIPHVGGGNTEHIGNLRVACSKCNLAKGRGYTQSDLKISIRNFLEMYSLWSTKPPIKI